MSNNKHYHLKRGDVLTIIINKKKKVVEVLSENDKSSKYEPLRIGSRLFRFLEKEATNALLKEVKDKKNNKISIRSIKRN